MGEGMYLLVKFDNGTDARIEVNPSSTFKVLDQSNNTTAAFAFNDVTDVTFHLALPTTTVSETPVKAAAEPEVAAAPAVTAEEPGDADTTVLAPEVAAPTDPPVAASSDVSSEPQTISSTTTTDTADHQIAVTDAQSAVAAVSSHAPRGRKAKAAKALTDVEAALAQFPESPELLDAKTQLEQLAV